jgi:curli biogenesis system outer membrane secretion channel CsgG
MGVLVTIICGCTGSATRPDLPPEGGAIAVWNFEDLSPLINPVVEFGEFLSGAVAEVFQKSDEYQVVEREKLLLTIEELNLGTSEVVDERTRLRLGRLVGARWMVFGGYQIVGKLMRLELRKVDVETGVVVKSSSKIVDSGNMSVWIESAKAAAAELL